MSTFFLERPVRAFLSPIEQRIGVGIVPRLSSRANPGSSRIADITPFAALNRALPVALASRAMLVVCTIVALMTIAALPLVSLHSVTRMALAFAMTQAIRFLLLHQRESPVEWRPE